MNDTASSKILERNDKIVHVKHALLLCQPLVRALAHHVIQALIWTQFKNHVDILAILEVVIESHHLVVIQGTVNRDLGLKLGQNFRFLDQTLLNYLGREHHVSVRICYLIAFRESTLSKEFSLAVSSG
jgi:hypothetical protein